jgi:hypothetical protein
LIDASANLIDASAKLIKLSANLLSQSAKLIVACANLIEASARLLTACANLNLNERHWFAKVRHVSNVMPQLKVLLKKESKFSCG